MSPPRIDSVVIVGGGFSGALLAVNLLRHGGPRVLLVERRAALGAGVAYDAPNPEHLLNVRAANMSAFHDEPAHFADWLAGQKGAPADFAPRRLYGAYLSGLFGQAAADQRLTLVPGEAVAADMGAEAVTVRLADGRALIADALTLAMGNLPPYPPAGIDPQALGPAYANDPWGAGALDGLAADAPVLLIGTGLTMIDVALSLDARGHRGPVLALSRRGLLPRAHGETGQGGLAGRPPLTAVALLWTVRARAEIVGWRAAVDELRPHTQSLWRAAPDAERRRFLRHLRPWWDVHRHRLAPAVAARIDRMIRSGRLKVAAGRLTSLTRDGEALTADWRPRGGDQGERTRVARAINCSGPLGDLAHSAEPLLRGMIADGRARADAYGLGLDVDAENRVVGADGAPQPRVFAAGPMTRGAAWEITAVPDIRRQVWTLARRLSNAHWVEGEGL